MAQWRGQFTGLTHATKVKEVEDALRVAVVAFRAADPVTAPSKARAVRRLAARVLTIRLKALKAARAAATPVSQPSQRFERLRREEEKVRAAGVAGILTEFAVPEAQN